MRFAVTAASGPLTSTVMVVGTDEVGAEDVAAVEVESGDRGRQ